LGLGFKKKHRCPEVLANITARVFRKNLFEVPLIYLAVGRVWEATAKVAGRKKAMLT
jgi:hypothetical protein